MVEVEFQSIVSSLFPPKIFLIFKLIGFLPVKLTTSGMKFVPWATAITAGLILFQATLLLYITYLYPFARRGKIMTVVANLLKLWNVFFSAILIQIYNFVVCKNGGLASILTNIHDVEEVFTNKGLRQHKYTKSYKIIYFLIAFFVFLIPTSMVINHGFERWIKGSQYICHVYTLSMGVLFIRLAELLSHNFIRLNKLIRLGNFQEYKSMKITHSVLSSEPPKMTIDEIRQLHNKLCKSLEDINSFFGVQMLCVFSYIFVFIVINPYYIVDGILRNEPQVLGKLYLTKKMLWSLYAVVLLVTITWYSTYTTYHAKRTGFHVSCLLNLPLRPEIRNKVKLALMQISINTCEFSVLDLFKISTTNITTFAGMAVTYFIVILQFESYNKH